MVMRSQIRLRSKRFKNVQCIPLLHPQRGLEQVEIKTKFTTILASGPNGIPALDFLEEKIPREDNTIIAVNFSVTYHELLKRPYIKPDIWVVTDKRAATQVVEPDKRPWFPAALQKAIADENCSVCFNMSVAERAWNQYHIGGPFFTFVCKKLMHANDYVPNPDVIRPGGTVSCSALQIWDKVATHPERVAFICGVDLSGDLYARGKNATKKHGEVWLNSVMCLGGMIKTLNSKRKQVYVISKTMLTNYHKEIEFYPGSEEYLNV